MKKTIHTHLGNICLEDGKLQNKAYAFFHPEFDFQVESAYSATDIETGILLYYTFPSLTINASLCKWVICLNTV